MVVMFWIGGVSVVVGLVALAILAYVDTYARRTSNAWLPFLATLLIGGILFLLGGWGMWAAQQDSVAALGVGTAACILGIGGSLAAGTGGRHRIQRWALWTILILIGVLATHVVRLVALVG